MAKTTLFNNFLPSKTTLFNNFLPSKTTLFNDKCKNYTFKAHPQRPRRNDAGAGLKVVFLSLF